MTGKGALILVGLAAAGVGGWYLLSQHKAGASPSSPSCPTCQYSSCDGCFVTPATAIWQCALGNAGPAPSDEVGVMLGHVAWRVQTGQLPPCNAVAGWLPAGSSITC